jgi:chemotaxis protein MotB
MAEHATEIIIVKRRGGHEEEHHGGAWKIAFADFMTAMMAFFLVLWIINATDKNTKTVIARYFNPVKVEDAARSLKGVHGQSQTSATNPSDQAKESDPAKGDGAKTSDKAAPPGEGAASKDGASSEGNADDKAKPPAEGREPPDPAKPKATMSEAALFSDPIASLDRIVGAPPSPPIADKAAHGVSDATSQAAMTDDGFRDPFRPIGRDASADVLEPQFGSPSPAATDGANAPASVAPASEPKAAPVKPAASSDAPAAGVPAMSASPVPPAPAPAAIDKATPTPSATATQLLEEVLRRLAAVGLAHAGPGIEVKQTEEGLLISLTDRFNFSMFAIGSAEPQPQVVHVMAAIAESLKKRPGEIVVRGHTDAHPYKSANYDNWRLSAARAQMAYYMLMRAGLDEKRVQKIEGYADRRLKEPSKPFAAENRRIEILLRKAEP